MAQRLKTLLLISPLYDEPKRTTPSAPKIARQLSKLCRVIVLCGGSRTRVEDRSPRLRVYFIKELLVPDPANVGFVPGAKKLLRSILAKEKPDAVLNLKHSFPINNLVHELKREGYRIVTSTDTFPGHDWWTASSLGNVALWVYARLWPRSVLRASDSVLLFHNALVARAKRLKLPYTVIPNGVEFDLIERAKPKRLAGRINVLYVGRLESVKGYVTICEAMRTVTQQHADVHFYQIGDSQGKERFVAAHRSANIHFEGRKTMEETYAYMKGADIILLASRSEGLPNVIMEGMACGCVPASTPVGAVPELLERGKLGRLFAYNDAAGLARQVEWLIAHPKERASMAAAGMKKMRAEYNWSTLAKRYYDALFPSGSAVRTKAERPVH